jgi:hypothetical protein
LEAKLSPFPELPPPKSRAAALIFEKGLIESVSRVSTDGPFSYEEAL